MVSRIHLIHFKDFFSCLATNCFFIIYLKSSIESWFIKRPKQSSNNQQQQEASGGVSQISTIQPSTSQTNATETAIVQSENIAIDVPMRINYEKETAEYIHSYSVKQKDGLRRFVYCKLCVKYPDIVRRFCNNTKLPTIATETGIRFKKEHVERHFVSLYHQKCKETESLLKDDSKNTNKKLIDMHISEANKARANHIGKLLIQVYTDAKKLSLSAFSWPSRFVASEAGHNFDFNTTNSTTIPSSINIQYITPSSHLDLLKTITNSCNVLKEAIENALAVSIHIDGSVDRTQIDKIYMTLKVINSTGDMESLFAAIGQQKNPGALGLMEAVKNGLIDNIGIELYRLIMKNLSSICTDGANINRGEQNGLWALIEIECQSHRTCLPLNKFWCSAHRLDLVWKDLTNSTKDVKRMLDILSSIASYFNQSSVRSEKLKKIAKEKSLKLLSIPKIFEIRWSQWTFTTVLNILKSWNALMAYFEVVSKGDKEATAYETFLSDVTNLKLITFIADVLHVYQRYQKHLESDSLTIVSLVKHIRGLKTTLNDFKNNDLIGGCFEQLQNSILVNDEGQIFLKMIKLTNNEVTRSAKKRNFDQLRCDILTTLIESLENRFHTDEECIELIQPFIEFRKTADIRKVHATFASDLDLASFSLQFNDIMQLDICAGNDLTKQIKTLLKSENLSKYKDVITVLCRIKACTPQSADVERLVKANNLLKTSFRNKFILDTENRYMYIYFNMPPLELWDPRKAIITWLNEKERREHTDLMQKGTVQKQRHFKGIFRVASTKSGDDDDEYNINLENFDNNKIF